MGLLTRWRDLWKRSVDTTVDALWSQSVWTTPSVTGIGISQGTALNSAAVLACVTILAEDVAKIPWSIQRRQADGSSMAAADHWLTELLHEPNDWQNGLEFREQMQASLVMRGNAYAAIVRNDRGKVLKLVPVNADWVALWEAPDGSLFYRITPQGLHMRAALANEPFLIPFADMLHIRGFSLNGLMGVARIQLAKEAIALSLGQEQQAARWMANGAMPSGVLTTEQKLGEGVAERLKSDWTSRAAGLQNAGKTPILEQGLKWDKVSLSASDLEFLASRKFQIEDIARIFRVPLHMIASLAQATNNNVAQQGQDYVNYTLTGYTNRWREKYSTTFGLWREQCFLKFDYGELLAADLTARMNNWRTGIMSMIATPDEARIDLGLRPQGGDAAKLHYPVNMAVEGSQSTGTKADGGGRPAADASPARHLNGHGGGHEAAP